MLRALTVQQPWATAIAQGRKRHENRRRILGPVGRGEWLAVHAGLRIHELAPWALALWPDLPPEALPRRAVVGVVQVVGWRTVGWQTTHEIGRLSIGRETTVEVEYDAGVCGPVVLEVDPASAQELGEPVPCRGWLGLWRLPDEVEAAVTRQLSAEVARHVGRPPTPGPGAQAVAPRTATPAAGRGIRG